MRAQATHGLVDAERQLRARAALHNTQDTGAFDSSLDTMWRDATVNENTQLSQLDYDAFQKQADRALQEALAKIDSGDKRYATDSSLTASKYSADTGLQAAQFGANASAGSAAANAAAQLQAAQIAAGAQKYGDDARYNAALAQTDVDREKNYLGFTSSQQQSILDYLKAMFGSSADNLIGSLPFPTGTIVTSKP
jgi:hypothetical protein